MNRLRLGSVLHFMIAIAIGIAIAFAFAEGTLRFFLNESFAFSEANLGTD